MVPAAKADTPLSDAVTGVPVTLPPMTAPKAPLAVLRSTVELIATPVLAVPP